MHPTATICVDLGFHPLNNIRHGNIMSLILQLCIFSQSFLDILRLAFISEILTLIQKKLPFYIQYPSTALTIP
jgi:phosphoglycerol transferase MdoB-like AlkP superfamily enzyme